jgi:hypothetical protein
MKIDYDKILKQADKLKILPATIIKRKIKYRKSNTINNCNRCKNNNYIQYKNRDVLQCSIIGESDNISYDIEDDFICDLYSCIELK